MMYRHYTTQEMNPDINPAWLEARRLENPDSFRREYLAEWTSGEGSYIDQDAVLACIRKDIGTLEPVEGVRYVSFLDPAYRLDSFVQAVAHKNAAGRVIIDGIFSWTKKGHDRTLDAVAAVCRRYGIATLGSDQHGFDAIEDSLKKRGIVAVLRPWSNPSKEVALPALKVAFETGAIEIPHDDATFQELAIFEASPTAGGLTKYAAAGSGHDDRVMAIAGALMALKLKRGSILGEDGGSVFGAVNRRLGGRQSTWDDGTGSPSRASFS